jgi:hypothetical protein
MMSSRKQIIKLELNAAEEKEPEASVPAPK